MSIPELENLVRKTQEELNSLEGAKAETLAKPLPKSAKDVMIKTQDSAIQQKKEQLLNYQSQLQAAKDAEAKEAAKAAQKAQDNKEFNEVIKSITEPKQTAASRQTPTDTSQQPAKTQNKTVWIVSGVVFVIIVILGIVFIRRRKAK